MNGLLHQDSIRTKTFSAVFVCLFVFGVVLFCLFICLFLLLLFWVRFSVSVIHLTLSFQYFEIQILSRLQKRLNKGTNYNLVRIISEHMDLEWPQQITLLYVNVTQLHCDSFFLQTMESDMSNVTRLLPFVLLLGLGDFFSLLLRHPSVISSMIHKGHCRQKGESSNALLLPNTWQESLVVHFKCHCSVYGSN